MSEPMSEPVLIVMAMEAEAAPVAAALALGPPRPLEPNLPARVRASANGDTLLVTNGLDPRFDVDAIGTVPAALTAWAAASRFHPRLIISAGTAGGFARHGAAIGDIYLSQPPIVFHDRRIPLGPFAPYGVGSFPCIDSSPLARVLNVKLGRFTTGDSLDLSAADAAMIETSGAAVKDMESAAVAWVAQLHGTPFLGVRSITDIVDHAHPTADQFITNLDHAVANLAAFLPKLLAELTQRI